MTDEPNNPGDAPTDANPAGADKTERRSGRARFDSRGNAVWEWQTSTGVFEREVDTAKLKDLSAAELKLMETQALKKQIGATNTDAKPAEAAARQKREGGFNPYESASSKPAKPLYAKDLRSASNETAAREKTAERLGLLARLLDRLGLKR